MLLKLTTPSEIDEAVASFLKVLPTNCEPVYLVPQPIPNAIRQECFQNVNWKV